MAPQSVFRTISDEVVKKRTGKKDERGQGKRTFHQRTPGIGGERGYGWIVPERAGYEQWRDEK